MELRQLTHATLRLVRSSLPFPGVDAAVGAASTDGGVGAILAHGIPQRGGCEQRPGAQRAERLRRAPAGSLGSLGNERWAAVDETGRDVGREASGAACWSLSPLIPLRGHVDRPAPVLAAGIGVPLGRGCERKRINPFCSFGLGV